MKSLIIFSLLICSFYVRGEELTVASPSEPVKISQLKETDIPVNLSSQKKSAANDSPWMRMLMGLSIVGVLAAGLWLVKKKASFKQSKKEPAPEIKVLTQHFIGPKKSLAIIRVAGESILIGVTDQNISLIKELSLLDEDIPAAVPLDFAKTMEETDDFSMSGIKDFVSNKLKNMRTIQ
jgi:flagellar protein FliO/FliZ